MAAEDAGVSRLSWWAAEMRAVTAAGRDTALGLMGAVPTEPDAAAAAEAARPDDVFDLRQLARLHQPGDQGVSRNCIAFAMIGLLEGRASYLDTDRLGLPADAPVTLDTHRFLSEVGPSTSLSRHRRVAERDGVPDVDGMFRLRPEFVTQRGVERMRAALIAMGPLLTVMHVYPNFRDFTGPGVYRPQGNKEGEAHAVCIVGFEGRDPEGCWIIRNSLGTSWGDRGYFRVAYGDRDLDLENATFAVRQLVRL